MNFKKDISPVRITEVFENDIFSEKNITEEESEIIVEILKEIGGLKVGGALQILDKAKLVLLECTITHEEYRP